MLVIHRKVDQRIYIGDDIEIVVLSTGRTGVRLGIQAPKDIRIRHTLENQHRGTSVLPEQNPTKIEESSKP